MTYNVFGGTLNLTQSINHDRLVSEMTCVCGVSNGQFYHNRNISVWS